MKNKDPRAFFPNIFKGQEEVQDKQKMLTFQCGGI